MYRAWSLWAARGGAHTGPRSLGRAAGGTGLGLASTASKEQWAPALKILNSRELYRFEKGEIPVPQGPGLGLDINEDALNHYRA
jgi:L-alanine-DL-glutamate epimerase-like enolase superfamily enzyme